MARCVAAVLITTSAWSQESTAERPPNVIVIFMDDLAYADIGPLGAQGYATPNLDRMAAEGMLFTDFVVSAAVCSASRAALLTGCYHRRVGISGALGPNAEIGIHPDETTLAEVCRARGYATACFGKWHLGHHPKFLPLQHGFDEYFGLPYSNDMWPQHPEFVNLPAAADGSRPGFPPLPLIEGNAVINPNVTSVEQCQLTTWYTERAVDFIARHAAQSFFLYVPHAMVHVPLHVSEKFRGRSTRGLFGDVMMEVDWSVGQILEAVERQGLDEHTLVIFTSDNGPWLSYGDHAGSAGPLREGKGTEFEGGVRVPALMRWPGQIPAGHVCRELATTTDILPTVAALIGAPLPPRAIDGHDIRALLFAQPGALSPHPVHYCYGPGDELQAVRDRKWKLHLPHRYRTLAGRPGGTGGVPVAYSTATIGLELFDLEHDPGETTNVADRFPEEVARLQALAEQARHDLGDTLTNRTGAGVRPAGRLALDDPRLVW
ncbi:MAG: sulfatase [Pirellulaceae bacterium]|nr:sulfatase [Pirellulaceae bacterium]